MPVKLDDWNLDPGSPDIQEFYSLDLNFADDNVDRKLYYGSGMGSEDEYYKKFASLDLSNEWLQFVSDEMELYMSPVVSPSSVPNDDIWKKFDILDVADKCELDHELNDMFEDLTNLTWMSPYAQAHAMSLTSGAREIRNHDCMWAGHCVSEKHERNIPKSLKCVNLLPFKKPQFQKSEEGEFVGVTNWTDSNATAEGNRFCSRRSGVVAPTHARSILLPTRIVNAAPASKKPTCSRSHSAAAMRLNRSRGLDLGGESPRPETPQSLSDDDDLNLDLPDMKTVEDFVADALGYSFINDIVQSLGSECWNAYESGDDFNVVQFDRYQQGSGSNCSSSASPSKSVANKVKRAVVKQETPIPRHYTSHSFISDHCYHLSKNTRMDNLGVQTPSDSEEEIDVETVYGDLRRPGSRSSSSGGSVLPTNPSLSDRQQLQLTMATAINKKEVKKQSARTASVPNRCVVDDRTLKAKVIPGKRKISVRNEVKRTGCNKRGAQFDDHNDYVNKSVKRKKYQYQRHYKAGKAGARRNGRNNARSAGGGSSDSEVDSIERRTIHNSMERQRRIDLRNSFEELRKLIPHTAGNEKAAKVVILSCGAEFCKSLTLEDNELTRKKAELRRQQEMLMARVSQLRRSLAAQR